MAVPARRPRRRRSPGRRRRPERLRRPGRARARPRTDHPHRGVRAVRPAGRHRGPTPDPHRPTRRGDSMMRVLSVHGVLPEHRYPQAELTHAFTEVMLRGQVDEAVVERIHGNAGVAWRHLALPVHRYRELSGFTESNDAFIEAGVELGARAVTDALKDAGLTPQDVDLFASATVTGLAVPSLDARVAALTGMRPDVIRVPLVGLGCVAGAAGVARLHDYLVGHPESVAVLMSVELCTLTLQRDDVSMANLVASGLFGDGAAAVVAVGADRADDLADSGASAVQPDVLGSRSHLYPDSERTMGW